jgi:hypothetical protein
MTSPRSFSFEFFPPKTPEGADKLRLVRARLAALEPTYFSVTFGAGGSTKEGTWNTVTEIARANLAGRAAHLVHRHDPGVGGRADPGLSGVRRAAAGGSARRHAVRRRLGRR